MNKTGRGAREEFSEPGSAAMLRGAFGGVRVSCRVQCLTRGFKLKECPFGTSCMMTDRHG